METIAKDGDAFEQDAWGKFLAAEFPEYERFWQTHIVAITGRPHHIQLLDNAALSTKGKSETDIAIAQLHYTVLRHLHFAWAARHSTPVNFNTVFVGLSALCAAQDVAFEILERKRNPVQYDPWLESRREAKAQGKKGRSGEDAQGNWKRHDGHPLSRVREYRNKLIHGRVPPSGGDGMHIPSFDKVHKYVDWRIGTPAAAATDFVTAKSILDDAWADTLAYLRTAWTTHLRV